ncbi:MAG: hypothetical protein R3228_17475 [Halioglobus sp.]|nr:hypothetical protein [Halioglobus sp.]
MSVLKSVVTRTLLSALLLAPGAALAASITFTFETTIQGAINGSPFATDMTIVSLGDTDNRIGAGFGDVNYIPSDVAYVELAGIGRYDFLFPTSTYLDQTPPTYWPFLESHAGFTVGNSIFSGDILRTGKDAQFDTWQMDSPFGPFTGWGNVQATAFYGPLPTSGGDLSFDSVGGRFVTFTAQLGDHTNQVPLPGTLYLVALAGAALVLRRSG